jgi:integral membrane sensor domain MASE1
MVFLTVALSAPASRRLNLAVATVYLLVSIGNVVGETWLFIWLGSAVEAILLLLVVRYAWTWPRRRD